MMAVPLQTKDRIIGLIYVDSPFVLREFTKDDLSLLTVMANVAAIRIENARLAEVEAGRAHHAARPVAGRRDPGRHAARSAPPKCPASTWPASTSPAAPWAAITTISSPTPTAASALALGDVSGKGMPASLMMMAPARARARAGRRPRRPGRLHDRASIKPPAPTAPATASSPSSSACWTRPPASWPSPTPATIRRSWCAPRARPKCWKAAARCWAFCPWRLTAKCARSLRARRHAGAVQRRRHRSQQHRLRRIRRGALHRGAAASTARAGGGDRGGRDAARWPNSPPARRRPTTSPWWWPAASEKPGGVPGHRASATGPVHPLKAGRTPMLH